MNTPIVVLFFNRPAFLQQLISRLSEIEPKKLYLVCDGPRQNKVCEKEKVEECRGLFEKLEWDCEIQRNFSDVNLGCRDRIISGLDWVFAQEERVIILEDDCIPIIDFFPFAEAMLERYQNDTRILSVCGNNLRPQLSNPEYDVVFSKYAMIWGWATWRRAWLLMDRELDRLEEAKRQHVLRAWLGSCRAEWYWLYVLKNVPTTWDYRWVFTSFVNHGLHVFPAKCIVQNIGTTDVNATHMTGHFYELPEVEKTFAHHIRLPDNVSANERLDLWIEDHLYSRSFRARMKWVFMKLKKWCCQ